MSSLSYQVETWGTVILIELSSQKIGDEKLLDAAKEAEKFLLKVDKLFSTFKENSQVNLLRSGQLNIDNADSLVKEVWESCLKARDLTGGAFNPWIS